MTFRVNLFPESRHRWKAATGSKCPRLSAVLVNVFPVVRTGVPPLQGSTLTGSNAGSCDREAAFCSKRSGNAELYAFVFYSPKGIKTKAFLLQRQENEFGLSDIHRARRNSIPLLKNSGQVAHALPC